MYTQEIKTYRVTDEHGNMARGHYLNDTSEVNIAGLFDLNDEELSLSASASYLAYWVKSNRLTLDIESTSFKTSI